MINDRLIQELRELFPYAHEEFIRLSLQELEKYNAKNFEYNGDSANTLGSFSRIGAFLSEYDFFKHSGNEAVVWCLFQLLKQLEAVFWMTSQGYEGKIESVFDRLGDISIYAKLAQVLIRTKKLE